MESTASHIESIYDKAKTYTQSSIELYKLSAIDKTADVVSSIVTRLVLGSILAVFLLFINLGVSLYIGELLKAAHLGFLIVSLFYLLLGLILYIFNKRFVQIPITNLVIEKLLKTKEDKEKSSSIIEKENYEASSEK